MPAAVIKGRWMPSFPGGRETLGEWKGSSGTAPVWELRNAEGVPVEKRRERQKGSDQPEWFVPGVVVKFRDFLNLPYIDGIEKVLIEKSADFKAAWSKLEEVAPEITMRRRFTVANRKEIEELAHLAEKMDPDYEPPDFFSYFYVESPRRLDPAQLIEVLSPLAEIDLVYLDLPTEVPFACVRNLPPQMQYYGCQIHLKSAPQGIDAEASWIRQGGDGGGRRSGQRLIDVEEGWTFDHNDLKSHQPRLLFGVIHDNWRDHGTKVLGVVCAAGNPAGCIGVAPHPKSVRAVSVWVQDPAAPQGMRKIPVAEAIWAVLRCMLPRRKVFPGDVLLIEQQAITTLDIQNNQVSAGMPVEILPDTFILIQLATALGLVVVEPAGNGRQDGGGCNLDDFCYVVAEGWDIWRDYTHRPDAVRFVRSHIWLDGIGPERLKSSQVSGAIMVGAVSRDIPSSGGQSGFRRLLWSSIAIRSSNYGKRLDCFGVGEDIVTCTSNTSAAGFTTDTYTSDFGRTSGASAIIAGLALTIQGIAQAAGGRLKPSKVRAILGDWTTGTPVYGASQCGNVNQQVGTMPDMKKIVSKYFP